MDYDKKWLNKLKLNDFDINIIEEIILNFIPIDKDNKLLSDYNIYSYETKTYYDMLTNEINLSIIYIRKWINNNRNIFYTFNPQVKNNKYFEEYMFIFAIIHEVMHSYQYLIANELIDPPSIFMRDGYKYLIDTFLYKNKDNLNNIEKLKMSLSNYLYLINSKKYVIERNANVEACNILKDISFDWMDYDISIMFNNAMNNQLLSGYINNNDGSFKETYKKMFIINKYNMLKDDNNIHISDRIRYGLEIDKDIDVKKLILRNNIY